MLSMLTKMKSESGKVRTHNLITEMSTWGTYQDIHGASEEPYVDHIQELARHGLSKVGHHGQTEAMGVLREDLPNWDALQFVVAQLYKTPHLDEVSIGTELVIGPRAKKPLKLDIPIFGLGYEFRCAVS